MPCSGCAHACWELNPARHDNMQAIKKIGSLPARPPTIKWWWRCYNLTDSQARVATGSVISRTQSCRPITPMFRSYPSSVHIRRREIPSIIPTFLTKFSLFPLFSPHYLSAVHNLQIVCFHYTDFIFICLLRYILSWQYMGTISPDFTYFNFT